MKSMIVTLKRVTHKLTVATAGENTLRTGEDT